MRTINDLKMLQAYPLELKIATTKQRLREFVDFYGVENCHISFSGGKDSTVLLDIARQEYPEIKAFFVNTGLEYPEIKKFVDSFENVEVLRPKKKFVDIVREYGYPIVSKDIALHVYSYDIYRRRGYVDKKLYVQQILGEHPNKRYNCEKYKPLIDAPFKVSDKCCYYTKKTPLNKVKSKPITGTLTEESEMRKTQWLKKGCNAFDDKKAMSNPLSFWTEQDILKYIKFNNLEIAEVYGDIIENDGIFKTTEADRTGCVYCGFGCHMEKGLGRFERMKITHPKLYEYCLGGGEFDENEMWVPNNKGLGLKFVFDWCNENIKNFKIKY